MDDLGSTRALEPHIAIVEAVVEVAAALVVINEGDECAENTKEEVVSVMAHLPSGWFGEDRSERGRQGGNV